MPKQLVNLQVKLSKLKTWEMNSIVKKTQFEHFSCHCVNIHVKFLHPCQIFTSIGQLQETSIITKYEQKNSSKSKFLPLRMDFPLLLNGL